MKIYDARMLVRCHEDNARDTRAFLAEFPEGRVAKTDTREVLCATFPAEEIRGLDAELIPGWAIPYTLRVDALGGTRVYLLSHLQKDWLRWSAQRVMSALSPATLLDIAKSAPWDYSC